MKFKIEQIAICPPNPTAAKQLLSEMGAGDWADDVVVASGEVFGEADCTNVAALSFAYGLGAPALEFEVLHYQVGENWMANQAYRVSHVGMHCTAAELEEWRRFFLHRDIHVAQEVRTQIHTNPTIAGSRWYHYVVFDTFAILGVDIKFIVRRDTK